MGTADEALLEDKESTRALVLAKSLRAQERAYNAFLAPLDPRGLPAGSYDFCFALACSPDIRFREVLERLDHPRYQRWSLAAIATSCDITMPEFVEFWQDAQLWAALRSAREGLPDLVRDLLVRALGRDVWCARCNGFGWLAVDPALHPDDVPGFKPLHNNTPARVCLDCQGTGLEPGPADRHARKLLLEMLGVTGRGAALQIFAR
jgi:hypothetical protein